MELTRYFILTKKLSLLKKRYFESISKQFIEDNILVKKLAGK